MATPKLTRFRLLGTDGGPLRGEIRSGARSGESRPAVVLCHGFKGFKDWGCWPRLADRLAVAGLVAVSFNFSSSGVGEDGESFDEPERFGHGTFSGDLADLAAVLDRLAAADLVPSLAAPRSIGLLGHSRGGGTAVLHAARDGRIGALVTWAAVAHFGRWPREQRREWRERGELPVVNVRTGEVLPLYPDVLDDVERNGATSLDILAAAGRVRSPWLIVHGTEDEAVPFEDARLLERASLSRASRLMPIDGGSHTLGAKHPWAGPTPELERAMESTVAWMAQYLAG